MDKDVVLLTIPKMEIRAPLIGPAALKSILEKDGFSVQCYDFNIELFQVKEFYKNFPNWWKNNDYTFMDDDLFKEAWENHIRPFAIRWVELVAQHNPKVIGITVLSYWTERICNKMIDLLQTRCPDARIVLGGPGTEPVYGKQKLDEGDIDAYITGEGELSFLEYMRGNKYYPGINGRPAQQIMDMDSLPFPDYSDYDLSKYSKNWTDPKKGPTGADWLYITGTRGCVKRCTFCNVGAIWPKFVGKRGVTMAKELRHYIETTGIKNYYFTDSLLNGDMSQYEDLIDTLIEDHTPVGRIKGQWIVRGPKLIPPELWKKSREAGLDEILIGIESGCHQTRIDMKKGVREEDVEYTFEQCAINNIRAVPLLMVGYPTETDEDFEENLKFWERYAKFNKKNGGTIHYPHLGTTTRVLPNTPLAAKFEPMGMYYDEHGHWVYKDNTHKKRIERWFRYRDKALECGFEPTMSTPTLLIREYKEITGIDLTEKYDLENGVKIWTDHL